MPRASRAGEDTNSRNFLVLSDPRTIDHSSTTVRTTWSMWHRVGMQAAPPPRSRLLSSITARVQGARARETALNRHEAGCELSERAAVVGALASSVCGDARQHPTPPQAHSSLSLLAAAWARRLHPASALCHHSGDSHRLPRPFWESARELGLRLEVGGGLGIKVGGGLGLG